MKKALIIGASGFVGGYLARHLLDECDMEVYATKLPYQDIEDENIKKYDLDILEKEEIVSLLFEIRPDYIFHLAAQSSVGMAWKNPGVTIDINIKGSVNVMDAVRELYYKPRVLLIGSGEEYGHIKSDEIPISEETMIRPGNIYAATKVCQNMIGSIYAQAYDMEIMMVRAFNHIGPTQAPIFVVSDFCKQVAEIEKGMRDPVMYVGNLDSMRDFTDVRDVVRAYALLMEIGKPGETYNVGSGRAVAIREILNLIISLSDKDIKVEIDQNKIRPVDVPIIEADIAKIKELTGWKPKIPLQQTIKETLNYWRERV
ncbi:GDP-4-dehydro-6-deoxy-D-mannose reductase [Kineothrix alysoides]|uniref:GDP-4-dehydro-6-deoxy-D-mannose reductase n=1 Tax=Kineothrix alysoides TaxID=1469948 RepID=A0A4R1R1W6_9FIRM|nr:GDP-mannose 4,6-dehydratase [Kineothrix alysoides]TCL59346.1 GDP-4-dehydro-6-deoxy-D-mannose reductase [Kineothrix alysoides]